MRWTPNPTSHQEDVPSHKSSRLTPITTADAACRASAGDPGHVDVRVFRRLAEGRAAVARLAVPSPVSRRVLCPGCLQVRRHSRWGDGGRAHGHAGSPHSNRPCDRGPGRDGIGAPGLVLRSPRSRIRRVRNSSPVPLRLAGPHRSGPVRPQQPVPNGSHLLHRRQSRRASLRLHQQDDDISMKAPPARQRTESNQGCRQRIGLTAVVRASPAAPSSDRGWPAGWWCSSRPGGQMRSFTAWAT